MRNLSTGDFVPRQLRGGPSLTGGPRTRRELFNHTVDKSAGWPIFNDMVEYQAPDLDTLFHALGDATRRQMLRDLATGQKTVGQLAEPFDMSLAAASKHIKALESAGLIRREVKGRTHMCSLEPGPLASAHEWLSFYERFWTRRLDMLDRLLREDDANKARKPKGDKS